LFIVQLESEWKW